MYNKILTLSIAFLSFGFLANAQNGFGVKAGIGYNTNGELKEFFNDTQTIIDDRGKGKTSFNVGIFGKISLGNLYLKPELVYTQTTSEYVLNAQNLKYKSDKIDLPILLGVNVFGPLHIFAGPSFQYFINNDLENLNYASIEKDYAMGVSFGASMEYEKFGFDIRYERGLTNNEVEFLGINPAYKYRLDTRPEQIIFNLSYQIF